ncbi:GtrA family protein [Gilvimarinus polysaccharolyticus]|uniref:GtrA family protein n=1 Tax=Gilvimarinus polysaccharolyticus TaxID=863921 RepID=UPI0006737CBC|nr:GtrA family protein [Gilvimarinus polysaccharolyticus]
MKRLFFYLLVGGVGFIVDAALLTLLVNVLDFNPYLARLLSFPPAVLVTWLLNRQLVFVSQADTVKTRSLEYGRYFTVQTVGALINLAVYMGCLTLWVTLKNWPVLALAAGSVVALGFNYVGAKCWVFGQANRPKV